MLCNGTENPWMDRFNLPSSTAEANSEDSTEEHTNPALTEDTLGSSAQASKEEEKQRREAQEFRALLRELVYVSKHPNIDWKRREAAILLLGTFIKDVSAFLIRNPRYDQLQNLFDEVICTNFSAAPKILKSLLSGRVLQCVTLIMDCDIIPRGDQGDTFKQRVMNFALEQLGQANELSV